MTEFTVPATAAGERLDRFLAGALAPAWSRVQLQALVREGGVRLNDRVTTKPAEALRPGDRIALDEAAAAPSAAALAERAPAPEAIALEILHEDADLVVVNKPPGLVTHPGAGNWEGTLVNALLHHLGSAAAAALSTTGGQERPGIVHRLDKDTSGCLVVAKNDFTHRALSAQFAGRTTEKRYLALAWGIPRALSGLIDAPIGRHPVQRKKMAIVQPPRGRLAQTGWKLLGATAAGGRPPPCSPWPGRVSSRWRRRRMPRTRRFPAHCWNAGFSPGAPTRSASTSRTSAIRSSATHFTPAARPPAPRPRARCCTPGDWGFSIPAPAPAWNFAPRCLPIFSPLASIHASLTASSMDRFSLALDLVLRDLEERRARDPGGRPFPLGASADALARLRAAGRNPGPPTADSRLDSDSVEDTSAPSQDPLMAARSRPVPPSDEGPSLFGDDTPAPAQAGEATADAQKTAVGEYQPVSDPQASKAERLEQMKAVVLPCVKCPHLAASRTQVVFGVGNPDAELMFVGEAPGADEDAQGEPFVGRAGQLLNKIIQTMGYKREEVFIANVLKCRPDTPGQKFGNRPPTPHEMETCRPYLFEQIEIVGPKAIVALGATAVRGLLDIQAPLRDLRSRWHDYRGIPVMATYHPSYLLRNQAPSEKRKVWEDLLLVKERLGHTITERDRNYFMVKP